MCRASNFESKEIFENAKVFNAKGLIKQLGNVNDSVEIVACQDNIVNVYENNCDIRRVVSA